MRRLTIKPEHQGLSAIGQETNWLVKSTEMWETSPHTWPRLIEKVAWMIPSQPRPCTLVTLEESGFILLLYILYKTQSDKTHQNNLESVWGNIFMTARKVLKLQSTNQRMENNWPLTTALKFQISFHWKKLQNDQKDEPQTRLSIAMWTDKSLVFRLDKGSNKKSTNKPVKPSARVTNTIFTGKNEMQGNPWITVHRHQADKHPRVASQQGLGRTWNHRNSHDTDF